MTATEYNLEEKENIRKVIEEMENSLKEKKKHPVGVYLQTALMKANINTALYFQMKQPNSAKRIGTELKQKMNPDILIIQISLDLWR